MSAVLEAPAFVEIEEVVCRCGSPVRGFPAGASVRSQEQGLLVDCSVCGRTHTPGTETDPSCSDDALA